MHVLPTSPCPEIEKVKARLWKGRAFWRHPSPSLRQYLPYNGFIRNEEDELRERPVEVELPTEGPPYHFGNEFHDCNT